jgi:hypothetical protein
MAVITVWKALVGMKPEATAYTAEASMATTDVCPAFNMSFKSTPDVIPRKESSTTWGKIADPMGARFRGELTYSLYLRGQDGTAGTALYYVNHLKAAGLKVTTTGGVSNVIIPAETYTNTGGFPARSYTCWYYEDGKIFKMSGCQSNLKMVCKAGEPTELQFTVTGIHYATVDGALPSPSGVSTNAPPNFVSAGLTTVGSEVPILETFELDLGNEIGDVIDANSTTGLKGVRINNRVPKGKMNPEDTTVADIDYWGQIKAGTNGQFDTAVIGTAGNRWDLTIPLIQYKNIGQGDRSSARILDIDFDVKVAAGAAEGAEFTLTLT